MKERPILFSTEMIRAILTFNKTQTRRVIKPQPSQDFDWDGWLIDTTGDRKRKGCAEWVKRINPSDDVSQRLSVRCPYGEPGDLLYVKEAYALAPHGFVYKANYSYSDLSEEEVVDLQTGETCPLIWKSSRFMPKVASRIKLRIVTLQVQRVQEITEEDAILEGMEPKEPNHVTSAHYRFVQLWNAINKERGYGWDINPWVWVIKFQRIA
jgi:hypothetical protein